jgi:phosphoribosyl-ATP pyrophosphohydrolase
VVSELADLLYHAIVGLRWRAIPVRRVLAELARRFGKSGHEEKASR